MWRWLSIEPCGMLMNHSGWVTSKGRWGQSEKRSSRIGVYSFKKQVEITVTITSQVMWRRFGLMRMVIQPTSFNRQGQESQSGLDLEDSCEELPSGGTKMWSQHFRFHKIDLTNTSTLQSSWIWYPQFAAMKSSQQYRGCVEYLLEINSSSFSLC